MVKGQIAGLIEQTQQMQKDMKKAREQLTLIEMGDVSDTDLVKVVMTYRNDVERVSIDPSLLAEGEDEGLLGDLIATTFNDAVRKAEAATQEKMGSLTSGLSSMASMLPPGFKLPF